MGKVFAIDFEQFNSPNPNNTAVPVSQYLSVIVQGLKGRYNIAGTKSENILTIPYRNNLFDHASSTDSDTMHPFTPASGVIQIGYMYEMGWNVPSVPVTFNSQYLIKICLYVDRHH